MFLHVSLSYRRYFPTTLTILVACASSQLSNALEQQQIQERQRVAVAVSDPANVALRPRPFEPSFETLSTDDGLPENSVTCILQDHLGFLWLGTQAGVVRYDGYTMELFRPASHDSGAAADEGIITMFEDKDSVLWVGSFYGLSRFDRTTDSFTSFTHRPEDPTTLNANEARCIYEDRQGRLWVGTHQGLNLLDRRTGSFTRYYFERGNSPIPARPVPGEHSISIYALCEDPSSGDLLVGTELEGLWRFDVERKMLSKYVFKGQREHGPDIGRIQSFVAAKDGNVWMMSYNTLAVLDPSTREYRVSLTMSAPPGERMEEPTYIFGGAIEDQDGLIWVAFHMDKAGLYSIEPKSGNIYHYQPFDTGEKNTYEQRLFAIYEDRSRVLWLGTWISGVKKWDRSRRHFGVIRLHPDDGKEDSRIFSMCSDSADALWVSTSDGLVRYSPSTGAIRSYLTDQRDVMREPVFVTLRDVKGTLWLGTRSSGFIRFDPSDGSYRRFFDGKANTIQRPFCAMQDREGILWIGTDGSGLFRYDDARQTLTRYTHDPNDSMSLSQDQIRVIYEDRAGTLWVGTNLGGLNSFDRVTRRFKRHGFGCVLALHEDKAGNFWVGEYFTGLNMFDREKGIISANYSRRNGMRSNAAWGILEDDNGFLWIESDNGLLRFDTRSEQFRRYTTDDGLADNFIVPFGNCRDRDGTMYVTSSKGIIFFHPESITDDPVPPAVVIRNVSLFGRPTEHLSLTEPLSRLRRLTLHHDQNDLRIEYAGLHYGDPAKNKYRYLLERVDPEWVDAGTQRTARYTNLDPGTYVFRVTACNRDGVWNAVGSDLEIVIEPPWWRTPAAYLGYFVGVLGILFFAWSLQTQRLRMQQQFQMTRFEAEKLQEVDEMKSRFFTNVSHEFRTPLTLILGPVKQISERVDDEKTKEQLGVVYRNAGKLLTLVNQLLDIAKLESGTMILHRSRLDLAQLLRTLVKSFVPFAERKRITLRFSASTEEIRAFLDREKVESIVTNVLSNAFKFTPEGGEIGLDVSTIDSRAVIRVSDTGIGIPGEKLPRIFDRFYQVERRHSGEVLGTGIGLALTKELVELHEGTIAVASEEGRGSTVTVCLPLGSGDPHAEEMSESTVGRSPASLSSDVHTRSKAGSRERPAIEAANGCENPRLLIVEDNGDVRQYVREIAGSEYRILESTDGAEGWTIAVEQQPDIIVSDIMMPTLDGIELCKKLKSDERTSHIPVILLTAKASMADKIEGFETGADAYITKPFEPEELNARIRNLVEQRKRLHEHFRKFGMLSLDASRIVSVDKRFLRRVFDIIAGHVSDPSFGVAALAEEAAISRSVLHRKLVSLVGEPPVELIRRIRLTQAADLIRRRSGNISEIALEVGFSNPSYFSECFRKQFGVSPSQYSQRSPAT